MNFDKNMQFDVENLLNYIIVGVICMMALVQGIATESSEMEIKIFWIENRLSDWRKFIIKLLKIFVGTNAVAGQKRCLW